MAGQTKTPQRRACILCRARSGLGPTENISLAVSMQLNIFRLSLVFLLIRDKPGDRQRVQNHWGPPCEEEEPPIPSYFCGFRTRGTRQWIQQMGTRSICRGMLGQWHRGRKQVQPLFIHLFVFMYLWRLKSKKGDFWSQGKMIWYTKSHTVCKKSFLRNIYLKKGYILHVDDYMIHTHTYT